MFLFFLNIRGVNFLITVKIEIIIRKMEKVMCKPFSIWNSSICTVSKILPHLLIYFRYPIFFTTLIILGVFGWLKASRLACFFSHRITVHVLSEQYFSLTTISRNNIFQSCRTGPIICVAVLVTQVRFSWVLRSPSFQQWLIILLIFYPFNKSFMGVKHSLFRAPAA